LKRFGRPKHYIEERPGNPKKNGRGSAGVDGGQQRESPAELSRRMQPSSRTPDGRVSGCLVVRSGKPGDYSTLPRKCLGRKDKLK